MIWNVNANTFAAPNDSYNRNTTVSATNVTAGSNDAIASLVATAGPTLNMIEDFLYSNNKSV